MIEIHSLKQEKFDSSLSYYVKVCRPSPLGNPFHIGTHGDRDAVCKKYADWLEPILRDRNSPQLLELARLYRLHKKHGRLHLFCWCAPEKCHADFIKFVLNGGLKK